MLLLVVRSGCSIRGGRSTAPALHPILDVALLRPSDSHGTRRHVFGDDGAGRRIGAVADCHRRNQHGVRADPHMRTHYGAVLRHAVVIDEHGGRTNV